MQNPFVDLRSGALIARLMDRSVVVEWPDWVEPPLKKIGMACTNLDPSKRPSSQLVSKVRQGFVCALPPVLTGSYLKVTN